MADETDRKLAAAAFETAMKLLRYQQYGSEQRALKAFLRCKPFAHYSIRRRDRILRQAFSAAGNAITFLSTCRREYGYPYDYSRIQADGGLNRLAETLGTPRDALQRILKQSVTEWVVGMLKMDWIETPDDFRMCCAVNFRYLESDFGMHLLSDSEGKRLDPKWHQFQNKYAARYMNETHRIDIEGANYGFGIDIRLGPAGSSRDLNYLGDDFVASSGISIQKTDSQYAILQKKSAMLSNALPALLDRMA